MARKAILPAKSTSEVVYARRRCGRSGCHTWALLDSATLWRHGSLALLSGMFFRPLGGILIARRVIGAIPLLRIGTIMNCAGVGLLAIPVRFPLLAVGGLALIGIGATIPYTSVFNEAARLGSV